MRTLTKRWLTIIGIVVLGTLTLILMGGPVEMGLR
jgi:hypothetical protein